MISLVRFLLSHFGGLLDNDGFADWLGCSKCNFAIELSFHSGDRSFYRAVSVSRFDHRWWLVVRSSLGTAGQRSGGCSVCGLAKVTVKIGGRFL